MVQFTKSGEEIIWPSKSFEETANYLSQYCEKLKNILLMIDPDLLPLFLKGLNLSNEELKDLLIFICEKVEHLLNYCYCDDPDFGISGMEDRDWCFRCKKYYDYEIFKNMTEWKKT